MERARSAEAGRAPLFQVMKHRLYGGGRAELTGEQLNPINAWKMVRRRAKAAGITTEVCNHTFPVPGSRPTWRTTARWRGAPVAPHASTRTAQLYDRREDRVTLDGAVKINIRA
jgi:hypothetical protein